MATGNRPKSQYRIPAFHVEHSQSNKHYDRNVHILLTSEICKAYLNLFKYCTDSQFNVQRC